MKMFFILMFAMLAQVPMADSEIVSAGRIQALRRGAIIQSYNERFHVSNVTFACDQVNSDSTKELINTLLNQEVSIRRVIRLDEEDMNHLLDYKGGTYIPEYLATNTMSARTHFPDASKMRFHWSHLAKIDKLGLKWRQFTRYAADDQADGKSLHKLLGRRRRKRKLLGAIMPDDGDERFDVSCSEAGAASVYDQNYLHLCAICSSKRNLPPDRYPSVLNEVFCMPSNNGCLGNGQGKCVETIFNVRILKRRDDICRLCLKDTEALAVNEWETYVEQVSVGCECMLNKNSAYRNQWFNKGSETGSLTIG